jgi:hypothetical protein
MTSNATHNCDAAAPLDNHGIPSISSIYASWGYVVVGVVTPGACACVHPPLGHRLHRLYDPSLMRRGQRRPRLQCPRFSYALFASAMPLLSHVPTPMCERHVGERVGGDARWCHCTARQSARSRRWRLASVADDSHVSEQASLSGGVPELGDAGEPASGACCSLTTPRSSPRRRMLRATARACATSYSQMCLPCCVVPSRQGSLIEVTKYLGSVANYQKQES